VRGSRIHPIANRSVAPHLTIRATESNAYHPYQVSTLSCWAVVAWGHAQRLRRVRVALS
jgi:hypothetical protein